jgi:hypothetical protein
MKTVLFLLTVLLSFTGCQKYIEKKQEEAAISVVTSGRWKVSAFTKGSVDKSALFAPYSFQFQPTETVDAIRNGIVEKTGTWKVSVPDHTITSGFSVATEPLVLLNGTYLITNSSSTTVDATQSVNGEVWTLHLDKE